MKPGQEGLEGWRRGSAAWGSIPGLFSEPRASYCKADIQLVVTILKSFHLLVG